MKEFLGMVVIFGSDDDTLAPFSVNISSLPKTNKGMVRSLR